MLPGVVNNGLIQNIENVVIPGSINLENNWIQLLHRGAINPIPEHYLQNFMNTIFDKSMQRFKFSISLWVVR